MEPASSLLFSAYTGRFITLSTITNIYNKKTTHVSTCWRVCGKNLNIVSMCAMSPTVHTLNIS